jgi:hypothetical protein
MISTIRLVSTIVFIGLSETNNIGYYNLGVAPAERASDVAVSARDTKPCWCGEA